MYVKMSNTVGSVDLLRDGDVLTLQVKDVVDNQTIEEVTLILQGDVIEVDEDGISSQTINNLIEQSHIRLKDTELIPVSINMKLLLHKQGVREYI